MPFVALTAVVNAGALVEDDAQVLGVSVIGPSCAVYGNAVVRNCTLMNGAAVCGDSNLTGLILDGRVICVGHVETEPLKTYAERLILSPDPRLRRDNFESRGGAGGAEPFTLDAIEMEKP